MLTISDKLLFPTNSTQN